MLHFLQFNIITFLQREIIRKQPLGRRWRWSLVRTTYRYSNSRVVSVATSLKNIMGTSMAGRNKAKKNVIFVVKILLSITAIAAIPRVPWFWQKNFDTDKYIYSLNLTPFAKIRVASAIGSRISNQDWCNKRIENWQQRHDFINHVLDFIYCQMVASIEGVQREPLRKVSTNMMSWSKTDVELI